MCLNKQGLNIVIDVLQDLWSRLQPATHSGQGQDGRRLCNLLRPLCASDDCHRGGGPQDAAPHRKCGVEQLLAPGLGLCTGAGRWSVRERGKA